MNIRPAGLADIPLIRSIAHATWPMCYAGIITPEQIAYMLGRMYSTKVLDDQMMNGHHFLLSEHHGTATGFAGFEHGYRPARTRLHKLYVLPDAQGTGAGRALLEAVFGAAVSAGDQGIELNVNKRNPAVGFYRKNGFSIERDEVLDIGSGFVMDDHVMLRPLVGCPAAAVDP